MSRRIFVWLAHPKANSYCEALADAYATGAAAEGAAVRRMNLADMRFSMAPQGYSKAPLEPDLLAWQEALRWADHVVIVHPCWWGTMPAQAKAVLDRALTPGFAYKYKKGSSGWDKLLAGRTGDAIITSDTPPLIDTLIYRRAGRRLLRNQVYAFCGIIPKAIWQVGSIVKSTVEQRGAWLENAHAMGAKAAASKAPAERASATTLSAEQQPAV